MHAPLSGTPTVIDLGPLGIDDTVALIRAALGRELPPRTPRDGRTLHLIESTRTEVHAAIKKLVCAQQVHADLAAPIADWKTAEHASVYTTARLIGVLTRRTCPYAPVAAGVVASWRGLILAAIDFHDGAASFRDVTDRAEEAQRLARFYSSGAFHAAIGGI